MASKERKVNFVRIVIAVVVGVSLILIFLVVTRYFEIPILPDNICRYGGPISSPVGPNTPFVCPLGCVIEAPDYNCPPGALCNIQMAQCKGW